MATYELVVILDPFLTEEEYTTETDRIRDLVKKRGAEVTNADVWGKKRMAYSIEKKIEGHYILFSVEGTLDGVAMNELERTIRLSERVLREMITRVPVIIPRKVKVKKPKQEGEVRSSGRESYSAGQAGAGSDNR